MIECKHLQFTIGSRVARLFEHDGDPEVITGYALDLKINCSECGLPFEFIGLPGGSSPVQPMVNFDSTELRAPIKPSTDPVEHAKILIEKKL